MIRTVALAVALAFPLAAQATTVSIAHVSVSAAHVSAPAVHVSAPVVHVSEPAHVRTPVHVAEPEVAESFHAQPANKPEPIDAPGPEAGEAKATPAPSRSGNLLPAWLPQWLQWEPGEECTDARHQQGEC